MAANMFGSVCGNSCIAGSAPLCVYLNRVRETMPESMLPGAFGKVWAKPRNGDIDLFVPFDHDFVALDMRVGDMFTWEDLVGFRSFYRDRDVAESNDVHCRMLYRVADALYSEYGIVVSYEEGDWALSEYPFCGTGGTGDIRRVLTMRLGRERREALGHQLEVQVIVLNVLPNPGESWAETVTGLFDIDICTGTLETGTLAELGRVTFPPGVREVVLRGEFNYTIRPYGRFLGHVGRILKYVRRGFTLASLSVGESCSPSYAAYVTGRIQHMYAPRLCRSYLVDSGMSDDLAESVTASHLLRFLDLGTNFSDAASYLGACSDSWDLAMAERQWDGRAYGRGDYRKRIRLLAQRRICRWWREVVRLRRRKRRRRS